MGNRKTRVILEPALEALIHGLSSRECEQMARTDFRWSEQLRGKLRVEDGALSLQRSFGPWPPPQGPAVG